MRAVILQLPHCPRPSRPSVHAIPHPPFGHRLFKVRLPPAIVYLIRYATPRERVLRTTRKYTSHKLYSHVRSLSTYVYKFIDKVLAKEEYDDDPFCAPFLIFPHLPYLHLPYPYLSYPYLSYPYLSYPGLPFGCRNGNQKNTGRAEALPVSVLCNLF